MIPLLNTVDGNDDLRLTPADERLLFILIVVALIGVLAYALLIGPANRRDPMYLGGGVLLFIIIVLLLLILL